MIIDEISYMILETIRNNNIVDDENLDIRLIENWINIKRATLLRQNYNSTKVNLDNLQEITLDLDVVERLGKYEVYSYLTSEVLTDIVKSTDKLPSVVENAAGPLILFITTSDGIKLPFSLGSYEELKVSGNRRFNSRNIFAALRDHHLYLKNYPLDKLDLSCTISAVFSDPREVPGFNRDTDMYPVSLDLIEGIKNSVFDKDFRVILNSQSDLQNDATSDGINQEK